MARKSAQQGQRLVDCGFAIAALCASAVPVLHEHLMPAHDAICGFNHSLSTLTSLTDATVAVAAKVALALCALIASIVYMTRGRTQHWLRALAEAPLLRTALCSAAIVGIGLAAFDCCTAFHGASVDVTGSCHCWLTGTLAAIVAGVIMLIIGSGRAICSLISDAFRTVIALFSWIFRVFAAPLIRYIQRSAAIALTLFDIRYLHGRRGPPLLAA